MPDTAEIVAGLAGIAGRWKLLAILWHVYY